MFRNECLRLLFLLVIIKHTGCSFGWFIPANTLSLIFASECMFAHGEEHANCHVRFVLVRSSAVFIILKHTSR